MPWTNKHIGFWLFFIFNVNSDIVLLKGNACDIVAIYSEQRCSFYFEIYHTKLFGKHVLENLLNAPFGPRAPGFLFI